MECVFVGYGDIAGFFGNDDGQGNGFLRYAFGGTVASMLWDTGRMQPAALMRFLLIIMAPSCSGLFLKKMFSISR